jgi:hypothetical protein
VLSLVALLVCCQKNRYVQCVALLGRYSIAPAEARLLVRTARRLLADGESSASNATTAATATATPTSSTATTARSNSSSNGGGARSESSSTGVALLAALCAIATRRAPSCYFHFDGTQAASLIRCASVDDVIVFFLRADDNVCCGKRSC